MEDSTLDEYRKIELDKQDEVVLIKDATRRNGELSTPFSVGYLSIDRSLEGGVREGDFIVITGLPGHGKTSFLQNIIMNMSRDCRSCLLFSYEVIIDNLYAKFKSMGADIDTLKIYTPKQNTTGNLEWVERKIIEGKKKYGTKFIFIDDIDALTPKNVRSSDQKRILLKQISQELKMMAVELEVVVFLTCHVKKVQGRAVEMQDIAESSGIYQKADTVFVVNRNSSTVIINGVEHEEFSNISTIRFLKNRLTGDCTYFDFTLDNNIIIPMGGVPQKYKAPDEKPEIIVEEGTVETTPVMI